MNFLSQVSLARNIQSVLFRRLFWFKLPCRLLSFLDRPDHRCSIAAISFLSCWMRGFFHVSFMVGLGIVQSVRWALPRFDLYIEGDEDIGRPYHQAKVTIRSGKAARYSLITRGVCQAFKAVPATKYMSQCSINFLPLVSLNQGKERSQPLFDLVYISCSVTQQQKSQRHRFIDVFATAKAPQEACFGEVQLRIRRRQHAFPLYTIQPRSDVACIHIPALSVFKAQQAL